jgi:hypothetical protein
MTHKINLSYTPLPLAETLIALYIVAGYRSALGTEMLSLCRLLFVDVLSLISR